MCLWAVLIGVSDLIQRRIPNYLVFGAMGVSSCTLAWSGVTPLGDSLQELLAGVGLALVLTVPAYLSRQLGAGDVKLLFAVACLGGVSLTFQAFVVGALLAGVAALVLLRFGWQMKSGQRFLPFGTALAVGVIAGLCHGRVELWQ